MLCSVSSDDDGGSSIYGEAQSEPLSIYLPPGSCRPRPSTVSRMLSLHESIAAADDETRIPQYAPSPVELANLNVSRNQQQKALKHGRINAVQYDHQHGLSSSATRAS
ncbi:hypothetical protein J3458_015711 [Metarhizium acridum]|uniref:uncharacterized protein n=1 Tax=Metarhizium acridum TaxID=92637 RepID=UPI001C6C1646|nr:hypothetical protein J3458_015711 [Metarhizium acridum]